MPQSGATHDHSPIDFLRISNRLLSLALTQHSLRDFLREALTEALKITAGLRAFIARIELESGELVVVETAGQGWTRKNRKLRLAPHNSTQRGITGYVAITGEPYKSDDVARDAHHLSLFTDAMSEMAVPFFDTEGRVRGVVNIDSDRAAAFDDLHIAQVGAIAEAIGAALAFDEYRSRERLLVDIGLDLAAITDVEVLNRRMVTITAKALQCEGCSVFLFDESSQTLKLRAARGTLADCVGEGGYQPGQGLTGIVFKTGEIIRLEDPRTDPRWVGLFEDCAATERASFLAVPIAGRDKMLGVVRVSRQHSRTPWFRARFTESEERMLTTIAGQFGTSLENIGTFNRSVRSERMAAWGELSAKSAHMIGNRTFAIKGDINELKYVLSQYSAEIAALEDIPRVQVENNLASIVELTDSIERGVFRLEEILREFRDFVMATQLKTVRGELNKLVRDTVRETFPRRTTLTLQEDYGSAPIFAIYDPVKLRRGLSELIENAISFMPGESGTLRVTVRTIAAGEELASAMLSPKRAYACISIADSGPGVPDDMKSQIFNPFFSSRVKGMGLGLSIVKGIVDAHHGIIRETGEAGRGAQFDIYLPADTSS
jgi:signal transduction histidine kinase